MLFTLVRTLKSVLNVFLIKLILIRLLGAGGGTDRQLDGCSPQRRGVIVENKKLRQQVIERTKEDSGGQEETSSSLNWCHRGRYNYIHIVFSRIT